MTKKILLLILLLLLSRNAYAVNWCDDATCQACYLMASGTDPTLDDSQNTNTGAFGNTPVAASGQFGAALDFEAGDADHLLVTDDNSIDLATTDFTLVAWVKLESSGASKTIVDKEAGTSNGYQWFFATDVPRFRIDAGTGSVDSADTTIADTDWHHYAVVVDRSGLATFYLDGNTDGTFDVSGDAGDISNATNLSIGTDEDLTGNAMDGVIDELAIFSKILSAADIADIMNNGLSDVGTNWCADANNKGCWGMEDDGNETDLSSNGTTLTETIGDIPQSTDKIWGTYSRDFELSDADHEHLIADDGGPTDISGADQSLSLVAWVKQEQMAVTAGIFIKDDVDDDRQYHLLDQSTDKLQFMVSADGGTPAVAKAATSTVTGVWTHVVGVYNDTDLRLYLNGVLDANGADNPNAHTAGIYDGANEFVVGGFATGASNWDGLIDDIAIFDTDLDATDINDIMVGGLYNPSAAVTRRIILIM